MSRVIVLLVVVAAWAAATESHLVSPLFLPTPRAVALALSSGLTSGSLAADLVATTGRWLLGFAPGVGVGVVVGILMGLHKSLYRNLEFVLEFLRAIPIVSLLPLFLVIFGAGNPSKIAAAAWAACLYSFLNAIYGVQGVHQARLDAAFCYGANRWQRIRDVIIPDSLPTLIAGIRIALSMSLVVVVATEMLLGTEVGLGRRIYDAVTIFQMDDAYAAVFITGLLGYVANKFAITVENRVVRWQGT